MRLTPDLLLDAYAQGFFPMAEGRDSDQVFWLNPEMRGVIPLEEFRVPRSVRKFIQRSGYAVTVDVAFDQVVAACAGPRRREVESWINDEIRHAYAQLHELGHAHSVECWNAGRLAGGLYGVSLGAAFFAESMVSIAPGGSKTALVHTVQRLKAAGYRLLDVQFVTPHLQRFGAREIPRGSYMTLLDEALSASPSPSSHFCTVSPSMG